MPWKYQLQFITALIFDPLLLFSVPLLLTIQVNYVIYQLFLQSCMHDEIFLFTAYRANLKTVLVVLCCVSSFSQRPPSALASVFAHGSFVLMKDSVCLIFLNNILWLGV